MASRIWSPYDNPFYSNMLDPLVRAIDFERLRRCAKPKLFVCATNVRTNERKIFEAHETSPEVLLASGCLPALFRAVEVAGEFYWDGGYMGNPVLAPLLDFAQDLLIVEVNPLRRDEVPRRAADIYDRLNEITFNAALVQEIDLINTMSKMIERGNLMNTQLKPIRFHAIEAAQEMAALGLDSKNNVGWNFLLNLHELGRNSAADWLADPARFGKVGIESSINVDQKFVKPLHQSTVAPKSKA